ncbi:MAG: beta-ketoacyl-ACP synthase II [Alphaproteobacteria bacterium]
MRRVVVTGLGAVTPLGGDLKTSWQRLVQGESGIRTITEYDTSDMPVSIAGMVPLGDASEGKFNADDWMLPKDQRKVDRFILYGIAGGIQAIEDSGWKPEDEEARDRTGVMIGSGIGGLSRIYETSLELQEKGARRVSPHFIPSCLINLVSGNLSIKYGFRGPNHSVVTACSTGAHAIGDAARMIQYGDADVMVAGGSEAAVCRIGMAGFAAARALSTSYNDTPEKASRPWDRDRDGFVMGEGAGIMVLEELEHAKKRGAKIYAEFLGNGMSGDAHHVTSPPEDGNGAARSMKAALRNSGINPEDIDYVNAHGTSTPVGDAIEVRAAKTVLGDHANNITMTSTKSSIGHLLGAAGGVEAVFAVKTIQDQVIPPTLNLENPSDDCDLDFAPLQAKERSVNVALSNSFGFGGTNTSVIFKKFAG